MVAGGPLAPADRDAFLFAGKALFTLVAEVAGERYAFDYKLQRSRDGRLYFAKVAVEVRALWGGRFAGRYAYLGVVSDTSRHILRPTVKSELRRGSDRYDVLDWYLQHREEYDRGEAPGDVVYTVSHRGFCGRCARVLDDAESVRLGLGPVCRRHE